MNINGSENEQEWETDGRGRRFRRVGNGLVEYERTIFLSTGDEIPTSQLGEYQKHRRAEEERRKAEALEAAKNQPEPRSCPFIGGRDTQCKREKCVLFLDGRCSIAILADAHGTGQPIAKNAKCPFSVYGRCPDCAMNNNGCAVVRLAASTINK